MLEQRIKAAGEKPTEADLQVIAKRVYEDLLSSLCTQRRSRPADVDGYSDVNFTMIDYFQRLADLGGHASLCDPEIQVRREQGWSDERIRNLDTIIWLREQGAYDPLPNEMIDGQLSRLGYQPTDELRWMAQLPLFESCRDAYVAA